jgi:hypothetical protein
MTQTRPNIFKRLFHCHSRGSKKKDASVLELDNPRRNGAADEDHEYEMANTPLVGISPNPTQATVPNAPKAPKRWRSWLRRGVERLGEV